MIGLDPYRVPGPWDPQPVADAIAAGPQADVIIAAGYESLNRS